ncbi:MAG: hypothetical protein ACT4OK_13125 [Gemmobacter sp.]
MARSNPVLGSAVLAAALCAGGTLWAQSGNIELELNTAADVNGGCRLTYVATNSSLLSLDKTTYEVAVYDQEGIVKMLLALEFGGLPSGKTRVVQFDVPEVGCGSISRILVNKSVECIATEGPQTICETDQILSSRVRTIAFN